MTLTPRDNSSDRAPFLTIDEVKAYLRVNVRTVYRLIRAGHLPAVRVGRQWRVRPADLDVWLGASRNDVSAAADRTERVGGGGESGRSAWETGRGRQSPLGAVVGIGNRRRLDVE